MAGSFTAIANRMSMREFALLLFVFLFVLGTVRPAAAAMPIAIVNASPFSVVPGQSVTLFRTQYLRPRWSQCGRKSRAHPAALSRRALDAGAHALGRIASDDGGLACAYHRWSGVAASLTFWHDHVLTDYLHSSSDVVAANVARLYARANSWSTDRSSRAATRCTIAAR